MLNNLSGLNARTM